MTQARNTHGNWIYRLIRHRRSLLLLLIPGINLIFLVLLVFARGNRFLALSLGASHPAIGLLLICYQSYPVISDFLFLMIVLLLDYGLSAAAYVLLKKYMEPAPIINRPKLFAACGAVVLWFVIPILIVVILLSVAAPFQGKAALYYAAVAENDAEKLKSAVYYDDKDPEVLREQFTANGVDLSQPMTFKRLLSSQTSSTKQLDGSTETTGDARWIVRIGETYYTLTVHYLKDSRGDGIQRFTLTKR